MLDRLVVVKLNGGLGISMCLRGQDHPRWPADPELEWCPPGHGDSYTGDGRITAAPQSGVW